jgi:WD40 repeat protein
MKHSFTFGLALLLPLLQPMLAIADKAMPDTTLTGHTSSVIALAFSPDGTRLASAADDGLFKIWDLSTKKEVFSLDGVLHNRNQVRFSPDGQTVIRLGTQNNVLVIDAKSGKAKPPISITGLPGGPAALDLSPDGKTVAIVGRSTLRFYDLAGSAMKASYEVHKLYAVTAVAFSHDGSRVATASTDNSAMVIDIATAKVVGSFNLELKGDAVLFSRDNKTLITNSTDQIIRSFDIASGQSQKLLEKNVSFLTIDLSRDGKSLVLGGTGRAPWLLSLADGKLTDAAYDSEDLTRSAALSPDGKWLAGGGNGGSIFLWKVAN